MSALARAARSLGYSANVITGELNSQYYATDVNDPMSKLLVNLIAFTVAVGVFADTVERGEE